MSTQQQRLTQAPVAPPPPPAQRRNSVPYEPNLTRPPVPPQSNNGKILKQKMSFIVRLFFVFRR